MDLSEEIRKLAESKLTAGQFIVDVISSARQGPKKVLVVVDADQGINIDECAVISRQLSEALDESGLIADNYLLEVSTPGLDQPLKLRRQYVKNVGRNLKLKLQDGIVEGKLMEVQEDQIVLARETGVGKHKEVQTVVIPFTHIDKAFVLVSFK